MRQVRGLGLVEVFVFLPSGGPTGDSCGWLERHSCLVGAPATAATAATAAASAAASVLGQAIAIGIAIDGSVERVIRTLALGVVACARTARKALAGQRDQVRRRYSLSSDGSRRDRRALALLGRSPAAAARRALCFLLGHLGHRQVALGGHAATAAR